MMKNGKTVSTEQKWNKAVRWSTLTAGILIGLWAYWPEKPWTWSDLIAALYKVTDLLSWGVPPKGGREEIVTWAQVVCPLLTCVFLLSWLTKYMYRYWNKVRSLKRQIKLGGFTIGRDSVAIYGSNSLVKVAAAGTHFILAGNHFLEHAKNHIILMDNDDENLQFYKKHREKLSEDNTCIGLQQMSSFMMQSAPKLSYFNLYEEVARDYWKKESLRDEILGNPTYRIVILGYERDNLGYQLLKYGLMNNLFCEDQKITYDIFCKPEEAVRGFELLELMNGDNVCWHTEQWQKHLEVVGAADRILLCRTINPHILNQILLTCTTQKIYYYDPDGAAYPEKYNYNLQKMKPFGGTKDILTEDSMLKNALHLAAMERHYQYTRDYGTAAQKELIEVAPKGVDVRKRLWDELDGYTRNSNIVSADYYATYPVSREASAEEVEQRARLEHIRWSRFHFLCGWRYGEPADGKKKDPINRIHRDLVPWDELTEIDKEKDRQQVRMEAGAAEV